MKKALLVSLGCNFALITGMLWLHAEHESELVKIAGLIVQADENYISLLSETIDAIDSPGAEGSGSSLQAARLIVAAGKAKMEQRRGMELGQ